MSTGPVDGSPVNSHSCGLMVSPGHAQCSSLKWPAGPHSSCSLAFTCRSTCRAQGQACVESCCSAPEASTHEDPQCPPCNHLVPALTSPWEIAGGHLVLLFILICFAQARQVIKSSLPGTFWILFPVRVVLCPIYFSSLSPPQHLPLPGQEQLLLALSVADNE